ncbi:MAG TPA: TspO/MBR family protein [Candidatus Acidoferrum sp.]|nr:TspO/MBR family protein [Candidatus Acidoferrum sp.]
MVEALLRGSSSKLALVDILALEGTIVSYISAARKVDRGAADAFIPYAAWFAFATIRNAEIAPLNPPEG